MSEANPVAPSSAAPRAWSHKTTPDRIRLIMESTCELLIRDGYAAFNLRKVATHMGVRLGTIQHHFATREVLLSTAIADIMSRWGEGYDEALAEPGLSPDDKLWAVLDVGLRQASELTTPPLLMEFIAAARHEAFIADIVNTRYLSFRLVVRGILLELRPDLGTTELMAFATTFLSQMEGLILFMHEGVPARATASDLRNALRVQHAAFLTGFKAYGRAGSA